MTRLKTRMTHTIMAYESASVLSLTQAECKESEALELEGTQENIQTNSLTSYMKTIQSKGEK